jgi:exodeoxyribonuclease-3
MVLAGDYNVIGTGHQPQYPQFMSFENQFLAALEQLGFVDIHEHQQPGVQAYSWMGRRDTGYRYDYFHSGIGLLEHITNHQYLHETRTPPTRLTDHSAVTLTIDLKR